MRRWASSTTWLRAREAYERREWVAAYERLSAAGERRAPGRRLRRLWPPRRTCVGRHNDCVQALQRAYQAHLDAGDQPAAVAVRLLAGHGADGPRRGARSRAAGSARASGCSTTSRGTWSSTGTSCYLPRCCGHILGGELDHRPRRLAAAGHRLRPALRRRRTCSRHGPDAQGRMPDVPGSGARRRCAARRGHGRRSPTGEVSPDLRRADVYCSLIEACQEISDFRRAAQWTAALTTWCGAQAGLVPFTGQCAVHRGQIMRVRGASEQALAEFEAPPRATSRPAPRPPARPGLRRKGEVLRIRGEYARAEDAVRAGQSASATTHSPGTALLALARGRTDAASAAVRRCWASRATPSIARSCFPARSRYCSPETTSAARAALVAELERSRTRSTRRSLKAMAGHAVGALALAEGRRPRMP